MQKYTVLTVLFIGLLVIIICTLTPFSALSTINNGCWGGEIKYNNRDGFVYVQIDSDLATLKIYNNYGRLLEDWNYSNTRCFRLQNNGNLLFQIPNGTGEVFSYDIPQMDCAQWPE